MVVRLSFAVCCVLFVMWCPLYDVQNTLSVVGLVFVCRLLFALCLLSVVGCLFLVLRIVCCLLTVVCCLLFDASCLLSAVCR